jgi:hypothetical protein
MRHRLPKLRREPRPMTTCWNTSDAPIPRLLPGWSSCTSSRSTGSPGGCWAAVTAPRTSPRRLSCACGATRARSATAKRSRAGSCGWRPTSWSTDIVTGVRSMRADCPTPPTTRRIRNWPAPGQRGRDDRCGDRRTAGAPAPRPGAQPLRGLRQPGDRACARRQRRGRGVPARQGKAQPQDRFSPTAGRSCSMTWHRFRGMETHG